MELFSFLPELFIVVGLLLVILELIIGIEAGFDLVLIGSILVISGFTGNFVGGPIVSLVLASILSAVYFFYGRALVKDKLKVKNHSTNTDRLIGQTGVVLQAISPMKAGLVKVEDEEWRARSDQALVTGETIVVTAFNGVTAIVSKQ